MKIEIGDSRKENFITFGGLQQGEIFRIDNVYFMCGYYEGDNTLYGMVLFSPPYGATKVKDTTGFSYELRFDIGEITPLDNDMIIDEIIHNPTLNWD